MPVDRETMAQQDLNRRFFQFSHRPIWMNNNIPLGHIHEHPNYGQPDEEIDQIFEGYQSVKSLFFKNVLL